MVDNLKFGEIVREPDIRYAKDMEKVILDKEWLQKNEEKGLYFMYRDLWKKDDREKIVTNNLRYDITIIPSLEMGKEYVKTKGHYHPDAVPGVSYPEIYEVIDGKAHFLLQKKANSKILDVVMVEAQKGDKALIPPNFGHITINPGDKDLKMSNWVARSFNSVYGDIVELGGGTYFELSNGEFIKNEKYNRIPKIRWADPTELPKLGIESSKKMYDLISNPEILEFLTKPQEHKRIFADLL